MGPEKGLKGTQFFWLSRLFLESRDYWVYESNCAVSYWGLVERMLCFSMNILFLV